MVCKRGFTLRLFPGGVVHGTMGPEAAAKTDAAVLRERDGATVPVVSQSRPLYVSKLSWGPSLWTGRSHPGRKGNWARGFHVCTFPPLPPTAATRLRCPFIAIFPQKGGHLYPLPPPIRYHKKDATATSVSRRYQSEYCTKKYTWHRIGHAVRTPVTCKPRAYESLHVIGSPQSQQHCAAACLVGQ